jgi:hypothetical protein
VLKAASTKKNSTESLLLCLPPEIRNKIFTYALGGHNIIIKPLKSSRTVVTLETERTLLTHEV